jgi:hypothetical protein
MNKAEMDWLIDDLSRLFDEIKLQKKKEREISK